MAPWIVGFVVFLVYPMLASLYFSFTDYNLLSAPSFVGLSNYSFMLSKDQNFWLAVRNTLWIIAVGLPLRIVFAIFTASLLARPRRGSSAYRTVYFLPSMVPAVAAAIAFVYLLNPATGPLNLFLSGVGIRNPPLWFYDPKYAKAALVILALWGIGDAMIIFLAGLLEVPKELYEAAAIEGAGSWQRFRWITIPMISPVIFFSVIIGIIDGFQYFTEAYVAGATTSPLAPPGSPQGSLLFYSTWLYQQGFSQFHMGYASAMAWTLLVITMVCTLAVMRSSRRWVYYQGGVFG